ncbi:MAG: hypothetical protein IJS88_05015 [Alphaproteobacteria bacterium]|nr:hypothetical protein [Alphaproteobacteria bacterium]
MRKFIYLVGLLVITGCQDVDYVSSKYQQKLSEAVGKSAAYLYASWGEPQQITPIADNAYLATYYSSESKPIDGNYHPYGSEMNYAAMAVPNYGLPLPPPLFYCQTTFVIRNNIITDFNFNGDDCF